MDDAEEPEFTVESMFSLEADCDPDQTAESIENEINRLFQKTIQNDKPSNIVVIENKGWNLYQPYLKKLVGFHPISRWKPFHYSRSPRLLLYASINPNNDTILLTDAVKCGTEINGILGQSVFKRLYSKDKITKIIGYLATDEGLKNIQDQNTDVALSFVKVVDSVSAYEDEQKRMRLVYQNRMEPIDGEHPFIILRSDAEDLNITLIKQIIEDSIQEFYNGDYCITDNRLKIKDKKGVTVHFHSPEAFNINLKEYSKRTFRFEKIALRFKYSIKDGTLRIAAVAMTDDKRNLTTIVSRVLRGKCGQNFPYKACRRYHPLKRLNILRSSFCPMCIDNNISRYVISSFFEASRKVSEKRNIKWEIIERYDGI